MKLLIFLTCALLFELSTQIENIPKYMPINPKVFERGCRKENGTLICPKPKASNSTKGTTSIESECKEDTKCPIGYELRYYRNKYNKKLSICVRRPKLIIKPSNRINVCPKGTTYKCSAIFIGRASRNVCSCKEVEEKIFTSDLFKKKGINLLD